MGRPTGTPALSAAYQSVIGGLQWDDLNSSQVLAELRGAVEGHDQLSIKFNVDRFDTHRRSPDFMTGRIVGTIGPAYPGAPRHFMLGRHLLARATPGTGPMFKPLQRLNSCPAVVDEQSRRVYIDLGNALPSAPTVDGETVPQVFRLRSSPPGQDPGSQYTDLGDVPVGDASWYLSTAGIVVVPDPSENPLASEQIGQVLGERLELVAPPAAGKGLTSTPRWQVSEPLGGNHVRADRLVYRMDPGEIEYVNVYATRFGAPLAGASVIVYADPGQLQGPSGEPSAWSGSGWLPGRLSARYARLRPAPHDGRRWDRAADRTSRRPRWSAGGHRRAGVRAAPGARAIIVGRRGAQPVRVHQRARLGSFRAAGATDLVRDDRADLHQLQAHLPGDGCRRRPLELRRGMRES